jgi:hypothetical protein
MIIALFFLIKHHTPLIKYNYLHGQFESPKTPRFRRL